MKSTSTIDLLKTPHGYTLLDNQVPINKPSVSNPQAQTSKSNPNQKFNKQKSSTAPFPKKFVPQQNFSIYPYIYDKQNPNHKYIVIPARTQWFNLNNVHEIQKKALPQWFKQKKGVLATMNHMKFQKNQQLYRKYRNHIIQLGKTQYVTPLMSRKGLAGDACSIIRIHNNLQKWGLINYVHRKPTKQKQSHQIDLLNYEDDLPASSTRRKDGFQKDKTNITKSYDKDDLQLLKKITKKFRPACNSCQGICGVVWYEYNQKLHIKKFQQNPETLIKTVKSGQEYQYCIKVCYSCYTQKNFPVVLAFDDFTKRSILSTVTITDFDKKYPKKTAQFTKISQAIQKNKFNISKASSILSITQNQLFDSLMQMPIQNLQKISRVQPQTQDQNQEPPHSYRQANQRSIIKSQKSLQNIQDDEQQIKIIQSNLISLDAQQKKAYEQFLQSWLLKIYAKMELLQGWDKTNQWKIQQNQQIKKFNLAQKIKSNYKG